jgi:hypothetical protein
LLWLHACRAEVSWVVAVSLCIVGTALLKIFLYVCPPVSSSVRVATPSLSTVIYGALVLVIAAERRGWQRFTVLAAGPGLIAGIAGSRLVLNAHSALEVGIGWQRWFNKAAAPIRSGVECSFAIMKRYYGYQRVRYIGLDRNRCHLNLMGVAINLRRALVLAA